MVFVSRAACVVFKTTGGRLWNKPWGLPRLTKTQKENRRKTNQEVKKNMSVLKAAAAAQSPIPIRLARTPSITRFEKAARVLQSLNRNSKVNPYLPPAARVLLNPSPQQQNVQQ
jgi:hypothetical protein